MRKLILAISLAAVMSSGIAFAFDNPSDIGEIKKVRGTDQAVPTKVFKLVRLAASGPNDASVVSGDAVRYSIISDDGVTIALTTTSADNAFAGIAVTAIATSDSAVGTTAADDVGRRNWGYIQIHGPCLANISAGGTNGALVGQGFITSTDSGKITGLQTGALTSLSSLAGQINGSHGFFLDTPAVGDTQVEVFVENE